MPRQSTISALVRGRQRALKSAAAVFRQVEDKADRGAALIRRYANRRNYLITSEEVAKVLAVAYEIDATLDTLMGMLRDTSELVTTT